MGSIPSWSAPHLTAAATVGFHPLPGFPANLGSELGPSNSPPILSANHPPAAARGITGASAALATLANFEPIIPPPKIDLLSLSSVVVPAILPSLAFLISSFLFISSICLLRVARVFSSLASVAVT